MKQPLASTLCNVFGHPGLRRLAKDVAQSGRSSALIFWKCPRCSVEIQSIEVESPRVNRTSSQRASAYK